MRVKTVHFIVENTGKSLKYLLSQTLYEVSVCIQDAC